MCLNSNNTGSLGWHACLTVLGVLFLCVIITSQVWADETEILFDPNANLANPNVMFLLDTSGSMKAPVAGGGMSRMDAMKTAFDRVMKNTSGQANIGLIRYGGQASDNAEGVSFPAQDGVTDAQSIFTTHDSQSALPGLLQDRDNLPDPTSAAPVREFLSSIVQGWTHKGYTPIVDALYETALYYQGERSHFGQHLPNLIPAAHPLSYPVEDEIYWDPCDSTFVRSCTQPNCGDRVIAGSCVTNAHQECRAYAEGTTTTTMGTCQGSCNSWSTTPKMCTNCISTGTDEAGNSTGSTCTTSQCGTQEVCNSYSTYACEQTTTTQGECTSWETVYTTTCEEEVCVGKQKGGPVVYNTPIIDRCQSNYIVLMSDGRPEYSGAAGGISASPQALSEIKALVGACSGNPQGYQSGECGAELTRFLAEQDQSGSLRGKQVVETFAVAFGLNDQNALNYLESLVTAEDGFFSAGNLDELVEAFSSVLDKIGSKGASFASPTYNVSSSQPLGHGQDIYMPLFRNSSTPRWAGNIRKFKLVDGKIVDKNGQTAVDDEGVLTEESHDYWSSEAAGTTVAKGGAASKLPAPDDRKLYTDAGGTLGALTSTNASITEEMLRSTYTTRNTLVDVRVLPGGGLSAENGVACEGWYFDCNGVKHVASPANPKHCVDIKAVTTCQSQPVTPAYRDELLRFVRGENVDDDTPRRFMGDMLNSKPQLIDYDAGSLLVFGTNEGYLHALDVNTGVEQWAFMPETLLKNIDNFYRNEELGRHIYGIDGNLTIWKRDTDNDGEPDKTYAFFGLRRGGRAYYGFDLTKKNDPRLLWRITENSTGFGRLGEAWSKPTLAKMRTKSGDDGLRDVLVFGGGYDARKDIEDHTDREADQMGTEVYIVDALSGQLLWSLRGGDHLSGGGQVSGANALKHSVPGDIRVLDMDRNGALDRLYFADTGGNVWRVDMSDVFDTSSSTSYNYSKARLTHFAALGGASGDLRKFFYEPDVALMMYQGKPVMTISLGSGYRTHPLSEFINDRFYVLRDPHAYDPMPLNFTTLTNEQLVNVNSLSQSFVVSGAKGWYFDLPEPHEKVLAPAVTFLNKVVFTTFAKDAAGVGFDEQCEVRKNAARAYVLDLFTGKAVADLQRNGGNDRSVIVGYNELLDSPQVIFGQPASSGGGSCTQNDCVQTTEIRVGKAELPIVDAGNAGGGSTSGSVSLDMMPKLFWLDSNATVERYKAP